MQTYRGLEQARLPYKKDSQPIQFTLFAYDLAHYAGATNRSHH